MSKNTQLATTDNPADIAPEIMEKVLIGGDLSGLNPQQRVQYYNAVCASQRINPLTRPFEYITFDGKLTLYARRDCTEQLRQRDKIEILSLERRTEEGLYIVIAKAKNGDGRGDEAIGVVPMVEPSWVMEWHNGKKVRAQNPLVGKQLSPVDRAKAMKVAETQAKRRVTLSLAGLGIPDESEIEGIAEPQNVSLITREEQAEAENAASNAKLIEAGGTVTVIEPEQKKTRAARKPKEEAKTPWQDVVCHVGIASGPILGKKVSEIHRKALEWLRDKWAPNLENGDHKDEALLAAVGEYFLANPDEPEKTPAAKPEAKPVEADKPAPEPTGEPESKPENKMEWRSVELNIPNGKYGVGLPLGTFETNPPDSSKGPVTPLGCFRTFFFQGIPKIEAKGSLDVKDRILVNAIKAACDELKPFDDVPWLDTLDETKLKAEITRRFNAQIVSLTTREKVMAELSDAAKKAGKDPDSKEFLRYVLGDWENVEVLIEGEEP